MLEHVRDDELMDAAEGTASAGARRHVQACAACRERVEAAASGLDLAQDADVPEPSPLYWEAFRRQVGRKVGAERRWRPAAWAPALAAAAVAVIAIGLLTPNRQPAQPTSTVPAWSASLPSTEDDSGLAQLSALAAEAEDMAFAGCNGIADCLSGLSEEETLALADVLSQELGTGSDL
jgi:hypothetical protein